MIDLDMLLRNSSLFKDLTKRIEELEKALDKEQEKQNGEVKNNLSGDKLV